MQTREGVWENSKVCVNPSRRRGFSQRLSSSPKLPRVFASGYASTASVSYFFYKIYDKGSATETTTVPFYLNIKVEIHNTRARLRVNIHTKIIVTVQKLNGRN